MRAGSVVAVVGLLAFGAVRWPAEAAAAPEIGLGSSAAGAAFPDDWFFEGKDRPKEYRALEGKPAPEFHAKEWRGEKTSLADLKGKVVVLDFWATWCGPCMAAIPKNIKLVDHYEDQGVAFIGVHDSSSGWDSIDKVVREKSIDYPVALDDTSGGKGRSASAYSVQFWPTYVVIDRKGVVRGAGLLPDKVEDAVKALLAEGGGGSEGASTVVADEFPAEWYLGGDRRLASFRAVERKEMPEFTAASWIGEEQIDPTDWERKVLVVQFVRPEFRHSLAALQELGPVVEEFERQGVVFVAVCDARGDAEAMSREAAELGVAMPIAMDAPMPEGEAGCGVTGAALGVRFAPATVVVDRAGVVRAAGLKPAHVADVINVLLAEPAPAAKPVKDAEEAGDPAEPAGGGGGTTGG